MTENLNEPETKPAAKKRGGCLKIGLIAVIVLLAVLHFTVPGIVRNVANKELPAALGTEASLEGVSLFLPAGRVGLSGLSIQQPEGFDGEPFLTLGSVSVEAPIGKAMGQNPVTVNYLRVSDLSVRVVSDAEGVLNVTKVGPPPAGEGDAAVEEVSAEPAETPPVWVKEVVISNVNFLFEDLAREWTFKIQNLDLTLTNLRVGGAEGDVSEPGTLEGYFEIFNESNVARFKVHGKVGRIDPSNPERVPPIQLAVGLSGFHLDTVDPFMVPGARTAIGGSGLDFKMFLEIGEGNSPGEQALFGSYEMVTDQDQRYAGELGGTVAEPVLPFLNIFSDVLGNQVGRVVNLGENIAEGGTEAAKAAVDTGAAAVKGAAGAVKGAAGGLFRTARGIATLDKDEALGGIKDTTVGTVSNVTDTVTDTVGTAGEGVSNAGGAALGQEAVKRWWDAVTERGEAFNAEAAAWFESRPFPN